MKNKNKYILLSALFLAAFLERTLFDLGPNVELVTTAMILSAFYFGKKESFWTVFAIMMLSDLILGNSRIFLFTWSGFLIPALLAGKFVKQKGDKFVKILSLTGTGLSSNIFFYLWTNFGVWLMSSMYSKDVLGLMTSYINGLPFLKYQITSTLVFVPMGFIAVEYVSIFIKNWKLKINFLFEN